MATSQQYYYYCNAVVRAAEVKLNFRLNVYVSKTLTGPKAGLSVICAKSLYSLIYVHVIIRVIYVWTHVCRRGHDISMKNRLRAGRHTDEKINRHFHPEIADVRRFIIMT